MRPARFRGLAASLALVAVTWTGAASADVGPDDPSSEAAPPAATPPAAPAPAPRTTGQGGDIEDVELDRLLDVKLEEKLGTTVAVSRRTESVLRAPATMTTIDADRIRLSGATTIAGLLEWVPGVQVIRNGPGNWVVSLRGAGGLGGNDLVVLVDGMSMNNPLDGSVQWDLFPISIADVERVEVVRGPVSPIYGPNAYTGVINIVTRDAGFSSSGLAIRSQAGLDHDGRGLGAAGGRIVRGGDKLRLAWYWNNRYDATNSSEPSGGTHTPWATLGTLGKLSYQATKDDTVTVELALSRSRRDELDHLASRRDAGGRSQLLATAKYQRSGLVGGRLVFDAWTRTNVLHTDAHDRVRDAFSYAGTKATRAEGASDLALKVGWLSANAGTNVSAEHVDAAYVNPSDNDQVRFGYGFYGSATVSPWKRLDLSIAGRGDVPPTLGRFAGSYRASAVLHGDTTAVRLSAGSSYRAPSWVEAAGRFVDPGTGLILLEGTPSIAPPRNDAIELGVVWGPSVTFQLTPTVYASRLSNVMVEDFAPLVRKTFRNDRSDRFVLGGELEASWRIRENLLLQAWGGVLGFPNAPEAVATVGVPSQNSAFTGGAHVHATAWNERAGYGLGVRTFSSRSYSVRAGIPPQIRAVDVPDTVVMEAMGEVRPLRQLPLWTSLRVRSNVPHGVVASPLPQAAACGTVMILGLEFRQE